MSSTVPGIDAPPDAVPPQVAQLAAIRVAVGIEQRALSRRLAVVPIARVRVAVEERTSLSPDALTGMEANLRFAGPENLVTKVFGRLTAWQNWIFNRPNAVGAVATVTS